MEALGKYDAGGRAERGHEGAREESTRIASPVPCSPLYTNGGQGYSHIMSGMAATILPLLFGDNSKFHKLFDRAQLGVQRGGSGEQTRGQHFQCTQRSPCG